MDTEVSNKGHLPYLDGLRGMAILAVFLFHTLGPVFGFDQLPWAGKFRDIGRDIDFLFVYPLSYGYLGVSIFFVISGYCIHLSHSKNKNGGWPSFFIRRFFRIYPAYLFAICFFLVLSPWINPLNGPDILEQLTANVFAVQNLWEHLRFGINPSFWSIAAEIQLYLLYPLLLLLVRRLGWDRSLLLVACLEILIRILPLLFSLLHAGTVPFIVRSSPLSFWGSWTIGAYLAQHHQLGRGALFKRTRFDVLVVLLVMSALFRPTNMLTFPLCALTTAVAMDRFHTGRWRVPADGKLSLAWRHLCNLGVVSYSFYLFHQPLLMWMGKELPTTMPSLLRLLCLVIIFPIALAVAHVGYRLLEQPSIAAGRRVLSALYIRPERPVQK